MSILNALQRAVIASDTGVERLIVDRVTEAYDALLVEDVERYQRLMATAIVQMGYVRPITPEDRPTAVDKVRTLVQRAVADKQRVGFRVATSRMQRTLDEWERSR